MIYKISMVSLIALTVGAAAVKSSSPVENGPPSSDVLLNIVITNGGEAVCSGVYLGNGVVLTAKHCTGEHIKKAEVVLDQDGAEGPRVDAFLEWSDKDTDIAAYHLTAKINVPAAPLACRAPKIGEPIEVVGNPLAIEFIHTFGRVAGLSRTTDDDNEVPIDVEIAGGNSGGPVYDSSGSVLGVITEAQSDIPHPGMVKFMASGEVACAKYGKPSLLRSIINHWHLPF